MDAKKLWTVGWWVLALLALGGTTGCPYDPICPDCLLAGGNPCGNLKLSLTVPNRAASFTSPKLVVDWKDKGTPTSSSVNVGTPRSSEPWRPGMSIAVGLSASDFPEGMCNIPTNGPSPYGAWSTAKVQLTSTTDKGATETWPVTLKLQ